MPPTDPGSGPLYSARIANTYLKYLRAHYPEVSCTDIIQYAGMEPWQVTDEAHWFTQEQVDRFYDRIVALTGNPHIDREAGRFYASAEDLGPTRRFVLSQLGPARAFTVLQETARNFTRATHFQASRLGPQAVEVKVTPYPGVREKPFQCRNRIGFFEAILLLFQNRLPHLEHPECIHTGAGACRYIISWEPARSDRWKRVRTLISIPAFVASLVLWQVFPTTLWRNLAYISGHLVVLLSLAGAYLEHQELHALVDAIKREADVALERIRSSYATAQLVNEVGHILSKQLDCIAAPSDTIASENARGVQPNEAIHIKDDTGQLVVRLLHVLEQHLDFERGMLFLCDDAQRYLTFRAGYGHTEDQESFLRSLKLSVLDEEKTSVVVRSFRERKPIFLEDFEGSHISDFTKETARRISTHAIFCCPIVYEQESLGVLAVDNFKTRKTLRQQDLLLLQGIAPAIGISLHNFRLMKAKAQMEILATTDLLTGLHNRRPLEAMLAQLWSSRENSAPPIACLMIDIDHFKAINDRWGHAAGDLLLKELAQLLRSMMRETDTLVRWGGEEFAAILPHADRFVATGIAKRILEAVASHAFSTLTDRRLTVSIGMSNWQSSLTSTDQLLGRADAALYTAKRNGRNRVEIWDESMLSAV